MAQPLSRLYSEMRTAMIVDKRPAYVKTMAKSLADMIAQAERANQQREDLRRYLMSEKFYDDTSVQVGDVMSRMPDHIHIGG